MFSLSHDNIVMLVVPFIFCGLGFFRFLYFISVGYGLSVAALGLSMIFMFFKEICLTTKISCFLLVAYGFRLSGYLIKREFAQSYNKIIKDINAKTYPMIAKFSIWITCSLLYFAMISPVYFTILNKNYETISPIVGTIIMAFGFILESAADHQKYEHKKISPDTFVQTGLYKIVRCPNYLGEVIFWTGVFISGFGNYFSKLQWFCAIFGWVSIIYIMFGGARRLEIRQNKNYMKYPEYQKYVSTTPILLPLIPLYSVEKYKWLVG